jgi:hypothetical protein
MIKMRIYLVERNSDNVDWDEWDKVVVKAKNEKNAKEVASKFAYGFDEQDVKVSEVHLDDIEEVVLGSFCAG